MEENRLKHGGTTWTLISFSIAKHFLLHSLMNMTHCSSPRNKVNRRFFLFDGLQTCAYHTVSLISKISKSR